MFIIIPSGDTAGEEAAAAAAERDKQKKREVFCDVSSLYLSPFSLGGQANILWPFCMRLPPSLSPLHAYKRKSKNRRPDIENGRKESNP
jgi:hypothetical protein